MPKWQRNGGRFTVKAYYSKHGSWHCTIPKPIVNLLEITKEITFIIDSEKGIVKIVKGESDNPSETSEPVN